MKTWRWKWRWQFCIMRCKYTTYTFTWWSCTLLHPIIALVTCKFFIYPYNQVLVVYTSACILIVWALDTSLNFQIFKWIVTCREMSFSLNLRKMRGLSSISLNFFSFYKFQSRFLTTLWSHFQFQKYFICRICNYKHSESGLYN